MSVSVSAPVQALSQASSLRQGSQANAAGPLDSILQMLAGPADQSSAAPPPSSAAPVSPANAFDPSTFNALLSIQEQANGATPVDAATDAMSKGMEQLGDVLGPFASAAMLALI